MQDTRQEDRQGRDADAAPALWNPRAAVWWSLLFSPLFGAVLHLLNARAMGDEKGRFDNIAALVLMPVLAVVLVWLLFRMPVLFQYSDLLHIGVQPLVLLGWYFGAARRQERVVRERFGTDYPRRGWGMPILCAISAQAALGFLIALAFVLMIFGLA